MLRIRDSEGFAAPLKNHLVLLNTISNCRNTVSGASSAFALYQVRSKNPQRAYVLPRVCRLILRKCLVRVAVQPTLVRFRRGDHRMLGRLCVLGRVTVWRIIAAMCRAAFLAGPQMNPR